MPTQDLKKPKAKKEKGDKNAGASPKPKKEKKCE
jgi:hypothetical protein